MQWKNEYNKIIITVSIFSFVAGAVYSLTPFFYSKNFLISKTKKDLSTFVKANNRVLEDTRFSFLKKENSGTSCAYSKYSNVVICTTLGDMS